jgi:hypothetical protein
MRLNPFHARGKRGQTPAQVRAERDQLADDNRALTNELAAARELIDTLTEERDWFHQQWKTVGHRDIESGVVVAHLEQMLAAEQRKVAALERIAGPYVDSSTAPEPLYAAVAERRDGEITREFRALPAAPVAAPEPEPIGPITLVKPLAQAVGGAA